MAQSILCVQTFSMKKFLTFFLLIFFISIEFSGASPILRENDENLVKMGPELFKTREKKLQIESESNFGFFKENEEKKREKSKEKFLSKLDSESEENQIRLTQNSKNFESFLLPASLLILLGSVATFIALCAKSDAALIPNVENADVEPETKKILPSNRFSGFEKISSSSRAIVYKAVYQGDAVVVKQPRKIDENALDNEMDLFEGLNHPHIVKCLGRLLKDSTNWCIVTPLSGVDLNSALANGLVTNDVKVLSGIALQVLSAVVYLQDQGIIHGNISAKNVLVSKDDSAEGFSCKLTGFSNATTVANKIYKINHLLSADSLRTRAPEVFENSKVTFKSELWSFGVFLWELYTMGDIPYENWEESTIPSRLQRGERLICSKEWPKDLTWLIQKCWSKNPHERPCVEYIQTSLYVFTKANGLTVSKRASFFAMNDPNANRKFEEWETEEMDSSFSCHP